MEEKRPTGNGNQLRDYRIGKVEEAIVGHEARLRVLEEIAAKSQGSGISPKQLYTILAAILTAVGVLGYSFLTLLK